MTLTMLMAKPEGIYACVDYRLTDSRRGVTVSDAACKYLSVQFAPFDGGPWALFVFSGLAHAPDGTPVIQWLRETLRGESDVIDAAMRHVLARLRRDFAGVRHELTIGIVVLEPSGRRLHGNFSNVSITTDDARSLGRFEYRMWELDGPIFTAGGSGATQLSDADKARLALILGRKPRRQTDFMKLLAQINRRTAARDAAVSPFCQVAFVSSDPVAYPPSSQAFAEPGVVIPFQLPLVLAGVDITVYAEHMAQSFQNGVLDEVLASQSLGQAAVQRRP